MRTPGFLLIFLLIGHPLFAQDWQPIHSAYQYHYELSTGNDFIDRTIAVDSAAVIGADSVYYFNRIITDCDTCSVPNSILIDQPQNLQKTMWFSGDGNYLFADPDTFLIKSDAELGESWEYQPGVTATVTFKLAGTTFGQPDSTKVIELSTGELFNLSKKYGLLYFDYTDEIQGILGIGGAGLGYQLPGFFDFFEFEIGDVFMYLQEDFFLMDGTRKYLKWTVTDKTVYPDSIRYEFSRISQNIQVEGGFYVDTFIQQSTSFWRFDRAGTFADAYPYELAGPYISLGFGGELYGFVTVGKDTEDRITKQMGGFSQDGQLEIYTPDANNPDVLMPAPILGFTNIYTEGVGESLIHTSFFEDLFRRELIGSVIGGDTTGTIYSDADLLSSTQEIRKLPFSVSPNPSSGVFLLQLESPLEEAAELSVFDVLGKPIFQQELRQGLQQVDLDSSFWPPGCYFCTIRTSNSMNTIQLVRQKQ